LLDEFRDWLLSELKLLGNASHHAYSFGQANMATRAIGRLDELFAHKAVLVLDPAAAERAAAALAASADPDLANLRAALAAAAADAATPPEPVLPPKTAT
jgi:hypothetical protein